jgi:tetratricopeptide (TPR) repeat protein
VACPACGAYLDVVEQVCSACGESLGDFREGAVYYLNLVRAYLDGAQPSLAEEVMPSVVAEVGDRADLLLDVGWLYERLNRPDRAMAVFQRAVELGCDDGAVYARLGELYQQSGMAEEAQALYAQARRRAGDNPEFLLAQARYHLTRDPTSRQGVELLERTLRLAPEHATAHLLLARVYQVRDKTDAALTHYRQAAQLADAHTETGRDARLELGKFGTEASFEPNYGWGETLRSGLGMVLVPLLAALANARLSLLRVSVPAWFALFAGAVGAYLVVSGLDVPQNPGMCLLFGDEGAKERAQRLGVGLPGAALWFLALIAILLRV